MSDVRYKVTFSKNDGSTVKVVYVFAPKHSSNVAIKSAKEKEPDLKYDRVVAREKNKDNKFI